MQVPQLSWVPQPSSSVPQVAPRLLQLLDVQPQTFATPDPAQLSGRMHAPQSITLLQPSPIFPHSAASSVHFFATQAVAPHLFGSAAAAEQAARALPALEHLAAAVEGLAAARTERLASLGLASAAAIGTAVGLPPVTLDRTGIAFE